jgi:hypothetical protein
MNTEDERCLQAAKLRRIDAAFREGNLQALREAFDEPSAVPNGIMPISIGSCLVYAIYHSPIHFIRTLLEIGSDPNRSVDDGFPPLIAALSCTRDEPGAPRRTDVDEIVRLLLQFGVNPNERGINDYTPLHMAVAQRQGLAVQLLLDHGADPELRTRIDDCATPLEMAQAAGLESIAAILSRKGQPERRRLRSGLILLTDIPGEGDEIRRQHEYWVRLRIWLKTGEEVQLQTTQRDEALDTKIRINRGVLIQGLFYGVEGMRVGGTRRLEIAPTLAYGDQGVPDKIPPGAVLTSEITILEAC